MTLVTGANSGLGRFLFEKMSAERFTRESRFEDLRDRRFNCVVHAAFNRCRDIRGSGLAQIVRDNLILTDRLLDLDFDVFVFISSIDVYPKTAVRHHEDEEIAPGGVSGIYGLTKLMAESLVRAKARRYIILRPGLLVGPYTQPNTVTRILSGDQSAPLSLTADSTFYLVGYNEIHELVKQLIARGMDGIFNVVRARSVSLREVAEACGREPRFGNYRYDSGNVANERAASLVPSLAGSSLEFLSTFSESVAK